MKFSPELLVNHALLVRKHVLGAREDDNLGIGKLGRKNSRIQRDFHIDVVNARVICAARGMQALRSLGVAPRLDKIGLVIV